MTNHNINTDGYLFPGRWGRGHIHEDSAAFIFREGCKRVDVVGASTHSCRRTALTLMSNAGIPLRVIQEISGHRNLEQRQRYLEVGQDQVRGAIAALSMLTPVEDTSIEKYSFSDVTPDFLLVFGSSNATTYICTRRNRHSAADTAFAW